MSIQCAASLHVGDLRDTRYGEIVVVRNEAGWVRTSVYSTVGLNDCPLQQWRSLDPAAIAKDFGAVSVHLKGPQFWAIDEITAPAVGETITLGGLDACLMSETLAPAGARPAACLTPGSYRESVSGYEIEWKLRGGQPLYRLVSPGGQQYYLLAYCHLIDNGLNCKSLMTLGDRLRLPDGWRYVVGAPVEDVALQGAGQARMLADDFENSYLLRERAAADPGQPSSADSDRSAIHAAFSAL